MAAGLLTALRRPSEVMMLAGTALTYGMPSVMEGGLTEVIQPGAFTNLQDDDITLIDQHDPARLLARTGAGTLTLLDSPARLEYRASLPDTRLGRDVWLLTERGDYGGASVGMIVEDHQLTSGMEGQVHRTILKARLLHISPVGAPAYKQTAVATADRTERHMIWR